MFDKSETRYKTAWNHSFVLNNQIASRIELTDELFFYEEIATCDFRFHRHSKLTNLLTHHQHTKL